MAKDELREWALTGARLELERIYTLFPELRPNVAPLGAVANNGGSGKRAEWTPERRARQARLMRKRWKAGVYKDKSASR